MNLRSQSIAKSTYSQSLTILFKLLVSLSLVVLFPINAMLQTLYFGVVADVQYCDCINTNSRFYTESPDRLREAIDTFNTQEMEFVISLGDIIDRDWESFDHILPIFESSLAPTYHVLGNHEFSVIDEKKNQVVTRLGMSDKYYDFAISGWRFIVLDANDLSKKAYPVDTPEYLESDSLFRQISALGLPQAREWNGGISEKQLQWLTQQLEDATKKQQHVLVFSHMPVAPESSLNLWNNTQVMDLLENFDNVKAFFAGHNHRGSYTKKGGIHHLTFNGMVDSPDQNAFAIIKLSEEQITIHGFDRQPGFVLDIQK